MHFPAESSDGYHHNLTNNLSNKETSSSGWLLLNGWNIPKLFSQAKAVELTEGVLPKIRAGFRISCVFSSLSRHSTGHDLPKQHAQFDKPLISPSLPSTRIRLVQTASHWGRTAMLAFHLANPIRLIVLILCVQQSSDGIAGDKNNSRRKFDLGLICPSYWWIAKVASDQTVH